MRKFAFGVAMVIAVAACDPSSDVGILGHGIIGGGGPGGAATKLVFTQQPANTQATAAMATAVVVEAQDPLGNVDTSYNGVITLALSSNPDSALLGGNFSVSAIFGTATFSNLTVSKADTGYVLTAGSGALTAGFSTKFTITP